MLSHTLSNPETEMCRLKKINKQQHTMEALQQQLASKNEIINKLQMKRNNDENTFALFWRLTDVTLKVPFLIYQDLGIHKNS